jgi:hypothetical protein
MKIGVGSKQHSLKESLIKSVIPAEVGIQSLQVQRVTGSPLSRG